jgi:hypothetical protein
VPDTGLFHINCIYIKTRYRCINFLHTHRNPHNPIANKSISQRKLPISANESAKLAFPPEIKSWGIEVKLISLDEFPGEDLSPHHPPPNRLYETL